MTDNLGYGAISIYRDAFMCWLLVINATLIKSLPAEAVHAQKCACQKAFVLPYAF